MNNLLATALAGLPDTARVLDTGGWFKPLARATHVLDLMPYETRRCVLTPAPLAGERFTRNTWLQVDFLTPDLKLPFPDRFFEFTACGHTIEDLADPTPLLRELRRVSWAGYFETPSRLCEQTVGQRDRMGVEQGHPHHHWIVESDSLSHLRLFHKADSLEANPASRVPLRTYERCRREPRHADLCQLLWHDRFEFELIRGEPARQRAAKFAAGLDLRPFDRTLDAVIRAARRLVYPHRRSSPEKLNAWWQEMLRLSRPYSRIPLR
ncbi:MAG: hypothetical protein PHE83_15825 [Opitutaceae bacterium]|nr:hypothetical protein [Opitutaceae bacterium]